MEQPIERNEQAPVRNLKTNPADTIRAIAEIEGPEWFEQQDKMKKGVSSDGEYETSLPNALERLERGQSSIVHGLHGTHRWHVGKDGAVSFSEDRATAEYQERARELGFEIVP